MKRLLYLMPGDIFLKAGNNEYFVFLNRPNGSIECECLCLTDYGSGYKTYKLNSSIEVEVMGKLPKTFSSFSF